MGTNVRRDNRNRVLRTGEMQRKDGRYAYKYVDMYGKICYVYSWKLEPTDIVPSGKKNDISLREKIRIIKRDIEDKIIPFGDNMRVIDLVKKYVSQRIGVRQSTEVGYKYVLNILEKELFGTRRIDRIRLSDAKEWLIKLQQKDGRGYSTLRNIKGVLRPAFQMAVDDDLIRKNPFDFPLTSVVVKDSKIREALTSEQEHRFLEFIKNDKHYSMYYDTIYILLNTGLRISEYCGLTIADIDLDENKINVERQLLRSRNMEYYIEKTKTKSGARVIPITNEVADCFKRIIDKRRRVRVEPMVDGKCGFLHLDKNGKPKVALHWEHYIKQIRDKYNKTQNDKITNASAHCFRHTYCSRLAKLGLNPKTLQYLMGHADISITMNTYTHFRYEDVKEDLLKISV